MENTSKAVDIRDLSSEVASVIIHHSEMTIELISELTVIVNKLRSDNYRVVIFESSNSDFSFGFRDKVVHSIYKKRDIISNIEDYYSESLLNLFYDIATLDCITICKISGNVYGIGFGIPLSCDLIFSNANTNLYLCDVFNGINNSVLFPYLEARIGSRASLKLLIDNVRVDATNALQMGLFDFVGSGVLVDACISDKIAFLLKSDMDQVYKLKSGINAIMDSKMDIAAYKRHVQISDSIKKFID